MNRPDSPALGYPPDRRQALLDQLTAERFARVPRKPGPRQPADTPADHERRRAILKENT